jgi:hypothetical protein
MMQAHKERFKDAHWTHTGKLMEKARETDVLKESVAITMFGHNKKFVKPVDHPTVSRAPRDVDNHFFTGAVHKEAESEQARDFPGGGSRRHLFFLPSAQASLLAS